MPTDAAPTLDPVVHLLVLLLLVQLAVLRHASRRGRADAQVPPPTPLLLRLPPEVLACEILSFLTHPQSAFSGPSFVLPRTSPLELRRDSCDASLSTFSVFDSPAELTS